MCARTATHCLAGINIQLINNMDYDMFKYFELVFVVFPQTAIYQLCEKNRCILFKNDQ